MRSQLQEYNFFLKKKERERSETETPCVFCRSQIGFLMHATSLSKEQGDRERVDWQRFFFKKKNSLYYLPVRDWVSLLPQFFSTVPQHRLLPPPPLHRSFEKEEGESEKTGCRTSLCLLVRYGRCWTSNLRRSLLLPATDSVVATSSFSLRSVFSEIN